MNPVLLRAQSDALIATRDPRLRLAGWQLAGLAYEVEAGMWPDVREPEEPTEAWMGAVA